jgi:hypothetical protein
MSDSGAKSGSRSKDKDKKKHRKKSKSHHGSHEHGNSEDAQHKHHMHVHQHHGHVSHRHHHHDKKAEEEKKRAEREAQQAREWLEDAAKDKRKRGGLGSPVLAAVPAPTSPTVPTGKKPREERSKASDEVRLLAAARRRQQVIGSCLAWALTLLLVAWRIGEPEQARKGPHDTGGVCAVIGASARRQPPALWFLAQEWMKVRNTVHEELDPDVSRPAPHDRAQLRNAAACPASQTGRMRLVRSSGEVLERIVSKAEQERIQSEAPEAAGALTDAVTVAIEAASQWDGIQLMKQASS